MHSKIMFGAMAMAGLMLLVACNRETAYNSSPANEPARGSKNETVSAVKDALAGAVGTITAEITTSTKGFVDEATLTHMYEVQAGQLATMRAHAAAIKDFGQHMVDDHTKSTGELKTILMKSAPNFIPPMQLDSRREGFLNDLKGAKDEDFEGRYIAQQISVHNEALILMRGYAKDGDNPDIKAFAAKVQPVVQMHIDMIHDIDRAQRARDAQARNDSNTKTR
jgi:putative membrane protein